MAERFYGTNLASGAWTYDGFRCVNCGAILFHVPTVQRGTALTNQRRNVERSIPRACGDIHTDRPSAG